MRIERPLTLGGALEALADAERPLLPLAGGTDLLVHWPVRHDVRERDYLDLQRIDELRGIRWNSGALEIGALTTYWETIADPRVGAEFPILVEAARQVGAIQIQSRGTWAGNVVNGSPAADGVPVLMALDASVVLASRRHRRDVSLDAYYSGYRQGARAADELVVAIRVPRRRHALQRFVKVGPRRAQAIAKVGVAVTCADEGWRVVAASVAPTVRRCPAIERRLDEGGIPATPEEFEPDLLEDVAPIDDLRSTADYRRRVLARVLFDLVGSRG